MLDLIMAATLAASAPATREGLEPLAFLLGHCWAGAFEGGQTDTHCFEPVHDGQHIRDTHAVTGGKSVYRGETIYSWDGAAKAVAYTYWNSLGGVSRGGMRPDGDRLNFGEERYRGPDGREAVIATHWRRVGADAYEAVTSSTEMPSMNRTVRYQRVAPSVSIRRGEGALVHEVVVNAPVADVWRAISTAEGWRSWAVPLARFDAADPKVLETSYNPNAALGAPDTIRQRFVAAIPAGCSPFRPSRLPPAFPISTPTPRW